MMVMLLSASIFSLKTSLMLFQVTFRSLQRMKDSSDQLMKPEEKMNCLFLIDGLIEHFMNSS